MKRLLLLRHGKSDWNADFETDHDRPINERGVKAARAVGLFLKEQRAYRPDRLLCSSARRTRETLEHVLSETGWQGQPVDYLDALYLAAPTAALAVLSEYVSDVDVLMMVGHQPTLSGLLSLLVGGGQVNYPTAALAIVDFDQQVGARGRLRGQGHLQAFIPPRILPSY